MREVVAAAAYRRGEVAGVRGVDVETAGDVARGVGGLGEGGGAVAGG